MTNLEEQPATICDHAPGINCTATASELSPQPEPSRGAQELTLDIKLCATYRLAAEDLRKALARISVTNEEESELYFKDGVLLIQKYSGIITCQARVRLTEPLGEPFAFTMDDEGFDNLADIEGELQVQVYCLGSAREIVFSGIRAHSTKLEFKIKREPLCIRMEDELPPSNKATPGILLAEALRVVRPFSRAWEDWPKIAPSEEPDEPIARVMMTDLGLACRSVGDEFVYFDSVDLVKAPLFIPSYVLRSVRKFVRQSESCCVAVNDDYTAIIDENGTSMRWETPPTVNAKCICYAPKSDHWVARVSGKDIERAVKCITSVSYSDATVTLRVSPENECFWFEATVNRVQVRTPKVAIQVEKNTLDGEIAPRCKLESLHKLFVGTAGPTLELRFHRGRKTESKPINWVVRSIDAYALGGDAQQAEPFSCRVTRTAPGVSSE